MILAQAVTTGGGLGGWVIILGALFGILSVAGVAFGVVRAGFVKSQLEALRGDRDDLHARLDRVTAAAAADKLAYDTQLAELTAKLDAEHDKVVALERLVPGREQLKEMMGLLNEHFRSDTREHAQLLAVGQKNEGVLMALQALWDRGRQ